MKKTTHIIIYMLAMLLSAIGIQSAQAQAVQDALYIYRNDGGFNAFFFDDIERFEYSNIDTTGVAHDEMVVQEVYALDSLFRIPLSAIDSIGFVTPETVYKKDVAHTTESEMWNYVIGSDSATVLLLAGNTPEMLIPKVGDKIVTTKSRKFLPGGFYGRVRHVEEIQGYTIVTCKMPELTELFDQWVCKAAAESEGAETRGSRGARTRIFGDENSTKSTLPVYDKSLKIDLTNISYGINSDWSVTGSGTLDMGIKDEMTVRVFLAVRPILGINFDYVARMEKRSWFNLDIKGGVSGQFDFPLASTWTWITDTPFAIETEAGVSVSGSGEVELKIKRENVTSDYAMAQYNDCFYDEQRESAVASTRLLKNVEENSFSGKFTITAGPYFSSCLSLMKKEIGAVGTRYDAGIKGEVEAELKLTDYLMTAVPTLIPAYMMVNPTALYDALNRDGSVKFGPFCTGKIEASLGPWKKEFEMFDVNELYGFEGGLVPKFSGTSLTYDSESKTLKASASLGRKTLTGNKVGFAAYYSKSGKQVARELYDKEYRYLKEPNFKSWEQDLTGIGGGKEVTVYPITNLGVIKYEMLASPYTSYTVPVKFECAPEELKFDAKGGEETLTVTDNLDRKEDIYIDEYGVTVDEDDESKWLSVKKENGTYKVSVKPNTTAKERSGTVDFYLYNEDRSINLTLNVPVFQEAPDYEFSVSPEELIEVAGYSKDFKDGELTQQLTVKYPNNAQNIKVSSNAESWLTVDEAWASKTADDLTTTTTRKIHIKPNFDLDNGRDGVITVELTAADGSVATQTLTVKQSALSLKLELDPTELTLTAEEKRGAKYSNTATVSIKMDPMDTYITSAIKSREAVPSETWLEAAVKDDAIEVRAEANPVEADRTATLTYTVTMKDGGSLSKTVKVTQLAYQVIKAFTFSPETVTLTAQGGEKKVYVVGEDVEKITEIDCLSSSWLGGAASGLSMTLSAKPNEGKEERVGTVYITALMKDGTVAKEYLLVHQDGTGSGVEPGPGPNPSDENPFKYINFWVERNVQMVSSKDGPLETDTISHAYPAFRFTAENSRFTWSEDKKTMHVECQGYKEEAYNDSKTSATLSFDIDKTTNMVKNLQFSSNSSGVTSIHMLGYSIDTKVDATTSLALGDFPLQTNVRSYKDGRWTVADGLKFNSFSLEADTYTTYTKTSDIIDIDPIDPVSDHLTYVPTGDATDYVWLTISMEGEEEEEVPLEWPDATTMQQLKSNGLPIHEGNNPPTVNGTYLMSPLTIVSENTGAGEDIGSLNGMVMKFSSQADGQLSFDYYFITEGEADYANGESKALIQGDGSKFSICAPWKDSFFIISGDISNGTVSDMHCALANYEDADNPFKYAIIKDSDNSNKTTWEPMPDDD